MPAGVPLQRCDLVLLALEQDDLPGYAWVDHDYIPMGSDGVHCSTEGQVQAGYMFADAMIALLKLEKR